MSQDTNQRFVRSAWVLLLFQLAAAGVAVGVTAWATFRVRPLLAEKERLEINVQERQKQLAELRRAQDKAQATWWHPSRQLSQALLEMKRCHLVRETRVSLVSARPLWLEEHQLV